MSGRREDRVSTDVVGAEAFERNHSTFVPDDPTLAEVAGPSPRPIDTRAVFAEMFPCTATTHTGARPDPAATDCTCCPACLRDANPRPGVVMRDPLLHRHASCTRCSWTSRG